LKENKVTFAHVDWHFTIQNTSNQDEHVIKYFGHCIEHTALSFEVIIFKTLPDIIKRFCLS
jgi:DNA polymerase-3 subunit alpha (Gram-positive type)